MSIVEQVDTCIGPKIFAAGALVQSALTQRYLVPLRSELVNDPSTWGLWAGHKEDGETPGDCVRRELGEEAGYWGPSNLRRLYTSKEGFAGYLAMVQKEFQPQLNWENDEARWLTALELHQLEPKHRGLVRCIEKIL